MPTPILYENQGSAAFLVSEANNFQSRDTRTFDNTGGSIDLLVPSGTVFSIASYGAAAAASVAGIHGNGTFGAITPNPATAQLGVYTLIFTGATTFNLLDPTGRELAPGSTGVAYADQLGFTLTAGGTPFQAGDSFLITQSPGTGLITPYTGAAPAAGLVYNTAYVPATSTLKLATIERNCEVNTGELKWASGLSTPLQATALQQLKALGIIAR